MSTVGDLTGVVLAEKYELVRSIGRGGMGAVYEARNVSTRKRCAVKVLLKTELSGEHEVVKRFFREARAGGLIESEHVVPAFDSGIDGVGRVYYVMEHLQGEDLQQALKRLGALNPLAATKIALQVATGLADAHALGIVHRDLKPANLFLASGSDDEIKVKILDFGVAKIKLKMADESSSSSLTHTGSLLGTPNYMSPEQVRRASAIDESADVWSLGVVLFECLSGKLPWGNTDTVGELIAAVLTADVPSIQDHAPWVSPELAELVARALSRDPNHRPRSGKELRDALRALVADARLSRGELSAPTEQERLTTAVRLSVADTVMVGAGPRSGKHTSVKAAPRSALRALAVAAGFVGAVAASVWTLQQRALRPSPVAALPSVVAPSAVAPPTPSVSAQLAPSSAPAVVEKSLWLRISPANAEVSVDDVSAPVRAGRVLVQGPVGSVHTVRVAFAGQQSERRTAITNDGLIPSEIALDLQQAQNGRAAERAHMVAPLPARAAVADPPRASSGPPSLDLSEKFE